MNSLSAGSEGIGADLVAKANETLHRQPAQWSERVRPF